MKKWLLLLAFAGVPMLAASGCGGGAPTEGVMDAETEPEPELTEEEVAGEEEYIESTQ